MSRAGKLLVAAPGLVDPNFFRTVVLVVEDDEEGTMGVVLNRPLGGVAEELPFVDAITQPSMVFVGGPVQPGHGLALAKGTGPFSISAVLVDGLVGLVAPETEEVEQIRYFAGYAGWMPGQLDEELGEDAWWVVDALTEDVFTGEPDDLWRTVLKRQPGALALVATYPKDPTQN